MPTFSPSELTRFHTVLQKTVRTAIKITVALTTSFVGVFTIHSDVTAQAAEPEFSWDTIPRWNIFRSNRRMDDASVTRVANHYQITVLEKSNQQDLPYTEAGLADLAARLKAANPNIVNYAYWNSFYYWPGYEAGIDFYANWEAWSRDEPVLLTDFRMKLQHNNVGMRQWWVSTALQLDSISDVDGLFFDTLRPNAFTMMDELFAVLPATSLTIGNSVELNPNDWLVNRPLGGSYNDDFGAPGDEIVDRISFYRNNNLAQGKRVLFRGSPILNAQFAGDVEPSDLAGQLDWTERNVDFALAVYLMVAEEGAYFYYGSGLPYAQFGDNRAGYIWDTSYMEIFDKPLGKPLWAPNKDGYLYSRSFEYLDVSVNVLTGETSLIWYDTPRTEIEAINCGGGALTSTDGTEYYADQSFSGGSTYSTVDPISGTSDDPLYQTERFGAFSYNVPVANGTYDVLLQFAEIFNDQSGSRSFGIVVEGTTAVSDLDIFAEVGHDSTYDLLIPDVEVEDGFLSISSVVSVGNPKLSAFRFARYDKVLQSQSFELGLGDWVNVSSGDSHDWTRDSDGTLSSNTGPATGANGTDWYLYLETSSAGGGAYSTGNSAILEGPEIVAAEQLTFAYHMYGADMGTLHVDVYDGAWNLSVWSLSGQQQLSNAADYGQATVDLSGFSGVIKVRFRAVAIGNWQGDVAIDSIVITRSKFSSWAASNGLSGSDATEAAMPSGDGLPNLMKYTLGLDPNVASTDPMVFERVTDGGASYLSLSVARDPLKSQVLIEGLSSSNLVNWSTSNVVIEVDTPSLFRIRDTLPIDANEQRFLKLRFSQP